MKPTVLALLGATALLTPFANAAITISYAVPGNGTATDAQGRAGTSTDAAITAGSITSSTASAAVSNFNETSNANGAAGMFNGSLAITGSVVPNTEALGLVATDYFEFTLTATTGMIDLSSFSIRWGVTSTGEVFTNNLLVTSSATGITSNPLTVSSGSTTFSNTPGTFQTSTVDVSGTAFDSLSSVTFRLRFFDNTTTGSNRSRIDSFSLVGESVPEPSSALLLFVSLGAMLGFRRR